MSPARSTACCSARPWQTARYSTQPLWSVGCRSRRPTRLRCNPSCRERCGCRRGCKASDRNHAGDVARKRDQLVTGCGVPHDCGAIPAAGDDAAAIRTVRHGGHGAGVTGECGQSVLGIRVGDHQNLRRRAECCGGQPRKECPPSDWCVAAIVRRGGVGLDALSTDARDHPECARRSHRSGRGDTRPVGGGWPRLPAPPWWCWTSTRRSS